MSAWHVHVHVYIILSPMRAKTVKNRASCQHFKFVAPVRTPFPNQGQIWHASVHGPIMYYTMLNSPWCVNTLALTGPKPQIIEGLLNQPSWTIRAKFTKHTRVDPRYKLTRQLSSESVYFVVLEGRRTPNFYRIFNVNILWCHDLVAERQS